MDAALRTKFLTNTDETGRFLVTSQRTGRTYACEPIGDPHVEWGSVNQSTGDLNVKKGWKKFSGSIDPSESLITEENGFTNIQILEKGLSPLAMIEHIDNQYPDRKTV